MLLPAGKPAQEKWAVKCFIKLVWKRRGWLHIKACQRGAGPERPHLLSSDVSAAIKRIFMSESLMEKYHQLLQWRNDTGRKLNSTVRVNNKSYIITGRGSPSWKTSLEILRKKSWGSCLSETLPLSLHSGFPNWISPPPPPPPAKLEENTSRLQV